MFIKYCVFSLKCWIFLNSASSAAALVFYLPCVCTHTDTKGEHRKARVRNFLGSSAKTQNLMNTLYMYIQGVQQIMLAPLPHFLHASPLFYPSNEKKKIFFMSLRRIDLGIRLLFFTIAIFFVSVASSFTQQLINNVTYFIRMWVVTVVWQQQR